MSDKLAFMHIVEQLKKTKRTGWVREGVQGAESIADHMYRMGMLAMLSEYDHLDIGRCVMLALVHDLAEAQIGDITPLDGVSDEEKERREIEAMEHFLTKLLPAESKASKRIRSLWREYEDRQTDESKFVKDLDLFELGLQGVEYERDQGFDLSPFFKSTQHKIKSDEVQGWSAALMEERKSIQDAKSSSA